MYLTAEQRQLAIIIHDHVEKYSDDEAGLERLLPTIYDYMDGFKMIMDSTTTVQMDYLCQRYDGFYRFAKLMENMAQLIHDGEIEVPKDH